MMDKLSKNFVYSIDRLYWLDKRFFPEDELEKLRLKCTVEGPPEFGSRNPIGPDILIFEETKELLGIPRALGIREFGFWPDRSRLVDAKIENFKFIGILRDKQKPAYESAVKKLQEPPFSGIIALPPGAGKTVLGLAIVEHFQTKTIVVVHKEFLMDQWIDRILQFTNVKRNEIGKVQADSVDVSGKKIVLGMMQSLYQKEYSNVFDKFGMVIYDECLDADTPVATPTGWKRIGDLIIGSEVLTPRGTAKVRNKWVTTKESYKYTLDSGRSLIASEDHLIAKVEPPKWQYANGRNPTPAEGSLVVSKICESDHLIFWRESQGRPSFLWEEYLVGLFLGDGCCTESTQDAMVFAFGKKDAHKWPEIFENINKETGLNFRFGTNNRGDQIYRITRIETEKLFSKYGLKSGTKSLTCAVPRFLIEKGSTGVIKGLFDAEGYVMVDRIGIDMTSKQCIKDISDILALHGILGLSRCYKRKNEKHHDRHRLLLFGENVRKFERTFGFTLDKRPTYIRWKTAASWRAKAQVDKIIAKEPSGVRELIDIELDDDDKLFVANGYLVHNCHRVGADAWSSVGKRFSAKFVLGCSATVSRGDDTDRILDAHIGKIIYEDLEYDIIPKVFQTSFVLDFSQEDVSNRRGEVNYSRMITKISECRRRNEWIANEIAKAYSKNRKILILSHRLDQLKNLENLLNAKSISHFDIGYYIGGMDLLARQRSENCKIMLATFQMFCIDLDSDIFDYSSGEIFNARDLIERKKKVSMCSLVGNSSFSISNFDEFRKTGQKACLEILTRTGKIVVSKDHKVLTQDGYKEAQLLTSLDYLVSPEKIDINAKQTGLTKNDFWMLGCIIGDGCTSRIKSGKVDYVSADFDITYNLDICLRNRGMFLKKVCNRKYHYDIRCVNGKSAPGVKSWLRQICESYDLIRKGNKKRLPKEFLTETDDNIASILGGLFDTDGCASNGARIITCSYSTVSKILANQIKFLLMRLGIPCYFAISHKKGYQPVNVIHIPKAYFKKFISSVDLRLKRKKELLESGVHHVTSSYWNTIPRIFFRKPLGVLKARKEIRIFVDHCAKLGHSGSAVLYSNRDLTREVYDEACRYTGLVNECQNKIFSKIKLITDVGLREVCDFSVPVYHNYLLNNYVVHNSEGADVPALDCLIFATPLNKIEQPIGRTLRKIQGKRQPVIVDIVDNLRITQNLAAKRREKYEELGFDTGGKKKSLVN